jgi:hypothetical protein
MGGGAHLDQAEGEFPVIRTEVEVADGQVFWNTVSLGFRSRAISID